MYSYVKTLYSEEAQARHTGRSHEVEGDAHLIPGGSDHLRHAEERSPRLQTLSGTVWSRTTQPSPARVQICEK